MMFKYKTVVTELDELDQNIEKYSTAGWRLVAAVCENDQYECPIYRLFFEQQG